MSIFTFHLIFLTVIIMALLWLYDFLSHNYDLPKHDLCFLCVGNGFPFLRTKCYKKCNNPPFCSMWLEMISKNKYANRDLIYGAQYCLIVDVRWGNANTRSLHTVSELSFDCTRLFFVVFSQWVCNPSVCELRGNKVINCFY